MEVFKEPDPGDDSERGGFHQTEFRMVQRPEFDQKSDRFAEVDIRCPIRIKISHTTYSKIRSGENHPHQHHLKTLKNVIICMNHSSGA